MLTKLTDVLDYVLLSGPCNSGQPLGGGRCLSRHPQENQIRKWRGGRAAMDPNRKLVRWQIPGRARGGGGEKRGLALTQGQVMLSGKTTITIEVLFRFDVVVRGGRIWVMHTETEWCVVRELTKVIYEVLRKSLVIYSCVICERRSRMKRLLYLMSRKYALESVPWNGLKCWRRLATELKQSHGEQHMRSRVGPLAIRLNEQTSCFPCLRLIFHKVMNIFWFSSFFLPYMKEIYFIQIFTLNTLWEMFGIC